MASLKLSCVRSFAFKRATVPRTQILSSTKNTLVSTRSLVSYCSYSNQFYLTGSLVMHGIEPRILGSHCLFHTSNTLYKDDEKYQNQGILGQDKNAVNKSKTPAEQVDELRQMWNEARKTVGVENVQWKSLQADFSDALKNLDPVAQSDEVLRQKFAELKKDFAFKVRLIDNPTKRYKDWPVIITHDAMKLVHDVKGKQYEAVLTLMRADGKQETFSIFKNQEGEKTRQEFLQYHDKLQPFYQSCPYTLNLTNLQEICTVIKEHPDWSVAHVGVAAKVKGCYRVPEIQKEINSQQCDLQQTPLHLAVESGQADIVQELLLCGVNVDLPDANGENVFHAVAKLPPEVSSIVSALLDQVAAVSSSVDKPMTEDIKGTGINRVNKDFLLPLHLALQAGNYELAHKFITLGSKVDLPDKLGYPIHHAMKQKQLKVLDAILESHKNQGKVACAKHGGTPLHWAKEPGFIEAILKTEHDLDALSNSGDAALHVMVKRLRLECALTLLCAGADVNTKGPDGDTALHMAIKKNNLDLVYCLVTFGADVNAKNNKDETPRHLASSQFMSALSSYVGSSSETLYVLHKVGAERCEPSMKGCGKGCKHGETYDGKPPETITEAPSETKQLYDDTLALSIGKIISGKIMGEDSVDAPMETDQVTEEKRTRHADTVLCLDGGGIRGLILVQLLTAIEKAAGVKIVDLFDWIAGTSTGGILALGLVHGYSIAECKKIYFGLKNAVFYGSRPYSSENLEKYLKEAFGEETTMDSVTYPRVMVTGTLSDRNPPALHLFRNFEASEFSSARQAAHAAPFPAPPEPKDQLVWRAARSSGAAPTYFRPLGRFLDGGLIANNPSLDALAEVSEYYMAKKMKREPVKKIGAVVSLGTGQVAPKKVSSVEIVKPDSPVDVINMATSVIGAMNLGDIFVEQCCESTGRSVDRARAWCFSMGTPFFRFNPPLAAATGLDEARDPQLFRMLWETDVYIRQNKDKIEQVANLLKSL